MDGLRFITDGLGYELRWDEDANNLVLIDSDHDTSVIIDPDAIEQLADDLLYARNYRKAPSRSQGQEG